MPAAPAHSTMSDGSGLPASTSGMPGTPMMRSSGDCGLRIADCGLKDIDAVFYFLAQEVKQNDNGAPLKSAIRNRRARSASPLWQSLKDVHCGERRVRRRASPKLEQGLQVSRLVNVECDAFVVDDQTFNADVRCFLAMQGQRVRPEARRKERRR